MVGSLVPTRHSVVTKTTSGRKIRNVTLPFVNKWDRIKFMKKPYMLDQMIFPSKCGFMLVLAEFMVVSLKVFGCWVKLVAIGTMGATGRWQYHNTTKRGASPTLQVQMEGLFVTHPVIFALKFITAKSAAEYPRVISRASFLSFSASPPFLNC
jgi:hypothetical protein